MSDSILYINDHEISEDDIRDRPELMEEINYDSSFNIPDSRDYTLDNTDPSKYDPKTSGSLLYGTKIFKLPVTEYSADFNGFISRGVISNVTTDSSNITIETTSQLSAISKNDVEFSDENITPADAIYKMLTAPLTLESKDPLVDPSYIDTASFRFAANTQRYNKCTVDIDITKDGSNKKKYIDVLPELTKIGHCFLYSHYDKIYMVQYTSRKNPSIIITDPVAGSYSDTYLVDDTFKVRNSYRVAYADGSSIVYASGKNMDSIDDYGESIWGIPSDDVGSDSTSDFNIVIDNYAGAVWCGETALERFSAPILSFEIKLEYKYNSIKVGDVIGFTFGPFSATPVMILSAAYDRSKNEIEYSGIFL